ncbi:MAG: hypothetical protein QY311_01795 [Candidatus Paceibacterota bacterium]|nr:MAG: hypothetical protein QY311_01795 [Candidatus Paceibacterota bacterium]
MTGERLSGDGAEVATAANAELQKAPVLKLFGLPGAIGPGPEASEIHTPDEPIEGDIRNAVRSLGSDVDAHGRPPVGEADLVVRDGELDRAPASPFGDADPAQVARAVPRVRIFTRVDYVAWVGGPSLLASPDQLEPVVAAYGVCRQHDLDMQGREWHAFDDLLFTQKPPP